MNSKSKVQKEQSTLKKLVAVLESENRKLKRQLARTRLQNLSLRNQVSGLEEELKKHPQYATGWVVKGKVPLENVIR